MFENLTVRDLVLLMNMVSMLGGAFYLVGMLRGKLQENTEAVNRLRRWLEAHEDRVQVLERDVAVLNDRHTRPLHPEHHS